MPDLILMDIALPGIDGVEAAPAPEGRPVDGAHPDRGADRLGDGGRPGPVWRSGVRGLIAKPIDVLTFPDQVLAYCATAAGGIGETSRRASWWSTTPTRTAS